jgi:hypothetical protein
MTLRIHLNVILTTSWSSQWASLKRFGNNKSVQVRRYMSSSSQPPWLHYSNTTRPVETTMCNSKCSTWISIWPIGPCCPYGLTCCSHGNASPLCRCCTHLWRYGSRGANAWHCGCHKGVPRTSFNNAATTVKVVTQLTRRQRSDWGRNR